MLMLMMRFRPRRLESSCLYTSVESHVDEGLGSGSKRLMISDSCESAIRDMPLVQVGTLRIVHLPLIRMSYMCTIVAEVYDKTARGKGNVVLTCNVKWCKSSEDKVCVKMKTLFRFRLVSVVFSHSR